MARATSVKALVTCLF